MFKPRDIAVYIDGSKIDSGAGAGVYSKNANPELTFSREHLQVFAMEGYGEQLKLPFVSGTSALGIYKEPTYAAVVSPGQLEPTPNYVLGAVHK